MGEPTRDPLATPRQVVLPVSDMDAAIAQYTRLLAVELVLRDGDDWSVLQGEHLRIALASARELPTGSPAVACRVENVDVAYDRAVDAGGTGIVPPADGRHERRAMIRTTAGHDLVFYASRADNNTGATP